MSPHAKGSYYHTATYILIVYGMKLNPLLHFYLHFFTISYVCARTCQHKLLTKCRQACVSDRSEAESAGINQHRRTIYK